MWRLRGRMAQKAKYTYGTLGLHEYPVIACLSMRNQSEEMFPTCTYSIIKEKHNINK